MCKRPTRAQYALRPGDRVRHPVYGVGTYLHSRTCGGITTVGVRWDVRPAWLDMVPGRPPGTECGCDLADLEVSDA
jgi:hypothetical protein